MALSYSSRWEMVEAVKNLGRDVKAGKLDPETITQETFEQYLCTSELSRP